MIHTVEGVKRRYDLPLQIDSLEPMLVENAQAYDGREFHARTELHNLPNPVLQQCAPMTLPPDSPLQEQIYEDAPQARYLGTTIVAAEQVRRRYQVNQLQQHFTPEERAGVCTNVNHRQNSCSPAYTTSNPTIALPPMISKRPRSSEVSGPDKGGNKRARVWSGLKLNTAPKIGGDSPETFRRASPAPSSSGISYRQQDIRPTRYIFGGTIPKPRNTPESDREDDSATESITDEDQQISEDEHLNDIQPAQGTSSTAHLRPHCTKFIGRISRTASCVVPGRSPASVDESMLDEEGFRLGLEGQFNIHCPHERLEIHESLPSTMCPCDSNTTPPGVQALRVTNGTGMCNPEHKDFGSLVDRLSVVTEQRRALKTAFQSLLAFDRTLAGEHRGLAEEVKRAGYDPRFAMKVVTEDPGFHCTEDTIRLVAKMFHWELKASSDNAHPSYDRATNSWVLREQSGSVLAAIKCSPAFHAPDVDPELLPVGLTLDSIDMSSDIANPFGQDVKNGNELQATFPKCDVCPSQGTSAVRAVPTAQTDVEKTQGTAITGDNPTAATP
ncbi:hypothetical protein PQX77_020860 [Marasmius sp. AFHP31]|nr:hypothetical protein PQX77_020860 [Marasmius sp. AFHP31]